MPQKINICTSNILDTLFNDYYGKEVSYSDQTSSFWKKYGEYQSVKKIGDEYKCSGMLFGNFLKKSLINSISQLPVKIYTTNLLKKCNPQIAKDSRWVADHQQREYCHDLARMSLTLNLLRENIPNLGTKTFGIIGDGYGTLGCLIKKVYPNSKIVYINLGRTLFFDLYYTTKCFPTLTHKLIRSSNEVYSKDFNYIEAEYFESVRCSSDVFINIASMQEMNPQTISNYFNVIRDQVSDTYFYCCNRLSKTLPDGEIINFTDYGWSDSDEIIVDELCSWHQRFPVNRPPFSVKFDGQHKHRLIKVSK